jgi:hypothetical protein
MNSRVFKNPSPGCVTTRQSVVGKTDFELEYTLGYRHGSLRAGYALYALAEEVKENEFYWLDRTRYSNGWHGDDTVIFRGVKMCVQRADERRDALHRRFNYDDAQVEAELAKLRQSDVIKLKCRSGPKQIVKLFPFTELGKDDYPDADVLDVPQWQLTVPKHFTLIGAHRGSGAFFPRWA